MAREGFLRARVDGEMVDLAGDLPGLDKQKKHSIDIVVDRLVVKRGDREAARRLAGDRPQGGRRAGAAGARGRRRGDPVAELLLRRLRHRPDRDHAAPVLVQQPLRRLPDLLAASARSCGVDPDKVVADPERSIDAGAIAPWPAGSTLDAHAHGRNARQGDGLLASTTPWQQAAGEGAPGAAPRQRRRGDRLHAQGQEVELQLAGEVRGGRCRMLERRYRETDSATMRSEIEQYMSVHPCPACSGRRLRPEALAVTVAGQSIDRLGSRSVRVAGASGWASLDARRRASAPSPPRWCRRWPTASAS